MRNDPFTILGVPYDATPKEISIAYRRLAREHHPDINRDNGSITQMQEINWAYEILSNPEKRHSFFSRQHAESAYRKSYAKRKPNERYQAAGVSAQAASYPSPPISIFGGTADRAIIGAVVGLVILGISLIFGMEYASMGAFFGMAAGVWVGSGLNTRISSQNGIGIGGVIGLFYGAIVGLSVFGSLERSSVAGALLVCSPSMILLGASLGAMLGGLASGLRKLMA